MTTDLEAMLASIQRAQANKQAKEKNSNAEAEADPLHELKNNTVTKSHALSRAYYRFNLIEKRCMEALISKMHPQRLDNPQLLTLTALEYAKTYNVPKSVAYRDISKAATGLTHTVITIDRPSNKAGKIEIPLMAIAEHVDDEGRIECKFNPEFLPHLVAMSGKFSSYPLKNTVDFNSSYTWRMYELLVSWAQDKDKTAGKFAGWLRMEVNELRGMMGVPNSYKWVHFSEMLDKSVIELREKARIAVFIKTHKTSRKITHLDIQFIEDEQIEMPLEGGKAPKQPRKKAA
jgi:plasmid replication initiation protein